MSSRYLKKIKLFINILKRLFTYFLTFGYIFLFSNRCSLALDETVNRDMVTTWGSTGDEFMTEAIAVNDGIVMVGQSTSTDIGIESKGLFDGVILKIDFNGKQQWINSFGGSNHEYFRSIVEASNGDYIVVGEMYFSNTDLGSNGDVDAIILRYSSSGDLIWNKNYGGSGGDYFNKVIASKNGYFYALGYTSSTDLEFASKGNGDALIVKYDAKGNKIWAKGFGGSEKDYFDGGTTTSDGGFVACGTTYSSDAGVSQNGDGDALIVKYDINGNQVWSKTFGGSEFDHFESVAEVSEQNLIAVGRITSSDAGLNKNTDSTDGLIIKYDKDGNEIWKRNLGANSTTRICDVLEAIDGGYVGYGYTIGTNLGFENAGGYDGVVVKYDS
jgi:hypothetical protein